MTLAQLKALLAKHVDAVEATDAKAMAATLKQLGDAVAEMETAGGLAGTKEFDDLAASLKQLRADVDAVTDAQRRAEKNGLLMRGGQVQIPGGRSARIEMLEDRRAFLDDGQAKRFGAYFSTLLVRLGLLPSGVVPKSVIELGESVIKDAEVNPDIATSGGNLIVDEFRPEMIRNIEAKGVVFVEMRRIPLVTVGTTTLPKRTGGVTAYPTAAGAQGTRSAPTVGTVSLTPEKWMIIVAICNEFYRTGRLLADLGQFIGAEIAYAFAYAFDDAVINGDGTAAYAGITGILQSANITAVAAGAGNITIAELDVADWDTFLAGLSKTYALRGAKWYLSLSVERKVRSFRTTTDALRVFAEIMQNPPTINGFPFTISQDMPAAATVAAGEKFGAFGDLSLSHLFGMVGDIQIDVSKEALFENDMTAIRALAHVDMAEADTDAIVTCQTAAE